MSNISNLFCSITIEFARPWLLLVIIPAVALTLWPFLRLARQHRRTRNRIVSLVVHLVIMVLCTALLSGMTFGSETVNIKNDVIFLVDVSDSTAPSREKMNKFVQSAIEESGGEYNIGIIVFGGDSDYSSKLGRNPDRSYNDYISSIGKPDKTATNIEEALLAAKNEFSDPKDGRIILLTDGLETDGKALAVTMAIAQGGTRIDVVYFSSADYEDEVQINSVSVPARVSLNETVPITVALQSAAPMQVTLSLFDNSAIVDQKTVFLGGGKDTYTFERTFKAASLHELCVKVDSVNDTLSQNNTYYSYVNIEMYSKVLIVARTHNDAILLDSLLGAEYEVEVTNLANAPKTLNEMRAYDEIILMNIANEDMTPSFVTLLATYVHDLGGGLLTVGGDKAYDEDDMSGTVFESILPIETAEYTQPLSMVIVLDSSGSMLQNPVGGVTKLALAKKGAVDCVNTLNDRDYVGVVHFNTNAYEVYPLSPATERDDIIDAINGINSSQGTTYAAAVEMASQMLLGFSEANLKHILFITDGNPTDGGYQEKIQHYAALGITLSVIAVGNDINPGIGLAMANNGNGNFHHVVNAATLPAIMVQETKVQETAKYNPFPFSPKIMAYTSVVAGITVLPQLGGYYGVKAKDDATVILGKVGDPIYAERQFGFGKVGSFMSDLSGDWSAAYFNDAQGKTFIYNMVRSLFPTVSLRSFGIEAEFVSDNYRTAVNIYTTMEEGDTVEATVTPPQGAAIKIPLTRLSSGTFIGTIDTGIAGIYTVNIVKRDRSGEMLAERKSYCTFSYTAEYNAFASKTDGFEYLESICNNGGGAMFFETQGMFGKLIQTATRKFDPSLAFLIAAIALFLLDIAARKFKFKLPNEIVAMFRSDSNRV